MMVPKPKSESKAVDVNWRRPVTMAKRIIIAQMKQVHG